MEYKDFSVNLRCHKGKYFDILQRSLNTLTAIDTHKRSRAIRVSRVVVLAGAKS